MVPYNYHHSPLYCNQHHIEGIVAVLQGNILKWFGHMQRKADDDCVKRCMGFEVKGPVPRG